MPSRDAVIRVRPLPRRPMARHLPIPDLPLRELIRQMYASPEVWEKMVEKKAAEMAVAQMEAENSNGELSQEEIEK